MVWLFFLFVVFLNVLKNDIFVFFVLNGFIIVDVLVLKKVKFKFVLKYEIDGFKVNVIVGKYMEFGFVDLGNFVV